MSTSTPLLERIKPLIHSILSSPNTIPSEVTAKSVRQTLIDQHGLSKEELNEQKKEVKNLILSIFREVYPDQGGEEEDAMDSSPVKPTGVEPVTPLKRKRELLSQDVPMSSPGIPLVEEKKAKGKSKVTKGDGETDEDIARKLQQSLSGERMTRQGGTTKSKGKRNANGDGKKSRVKSKAFVSDESGSEGSGTENGEARGKKKRKTEKDGESKPKGGFQKPYILSEELAAVVGSTILPRPQVVKQLWNYIKENNLQKPTNKKVIQCDEKLQKVFKASEIDMFQMNKVLGSHLRTADE